MVLKLKPFKLNDEGKEILEISKLLAKAGSSIKPTKTFTIGMLSAVKSFQKKSGLPVTGIVDKKTWEKLHAIRPTKKASKK